eukprot:720527-Amphidinium_carterae.1
MHKPIVEQKVVLVTRGLMAVFSKQGPFVHSTFSSELCKFNCKLSLVDRVQAHCNDKITKLSTEHVPSSTTCTKLGKGRFMLRSSLYCAHLFTTTKRL